MRFDDQLCSEPPAGLLVVNDINVAWICERHGEWLLRDAKTKGYDNWRWVKTGES